MVTVQELTLQQQRWTSQVISSIFSVSSTTSASTLSSVTVLWWSEIRPFELTALSWLPAALTSGLSSVPVTVPTEDQKQTHLLETEIPV